MVLTVLAWLVTCWLLLLLGSERKRRAPTASPNEEFAKVQGTWEFVSMEVEGTKKPEEEFKKYTAVLEGDQWMVYEGTNVKAQTPFELDPRANPKTIDLFPSDGRVLQGIYTLKDDQLTMCDRGTEKGDRPTEFGTKPDSGLVLVVLRRVKR